MAENKMKLWYFPQYRSVRCIWLVKELGIEDQVEYKFVPIGPPPPAPEREEYKKRVHPHSTVPALEIPGRAPILESAAICLYLADLTERLAPKPKDRAEYYNWILYAASTLDEAMEVLTMQWIYPNVVTVDPRAAEKALATVNTCLDNLERTLEGKQFILGNEFTAADCVLAYNLAWASIPEMKDGLLLKATPRKNVNAYWQRVSARPAFQAALALAPK